MTRNLLIMSPAPGVSFNRLGDTGNHAIAQAYVRDVFHMVIQEKSYHKDPHGANGFWDDDVGVTWIDWGVTGRVKRADLDLFQRFLMSIYMSDIEAQMAVLNEMASVEAKYDEDELRENITSVDVNLPIGSRILEIVEQAGLAKLYLRPAFMDLLSILLVVNTEAQAISPGYDIVPDLTWITLNPERRDEKEYKMPFDKSLVQEVDVASKPTSQQMDDDEIRTDLSRLLSGKAPVKKLIYLAGRAHQRGPGFHTVPFPQRYLNVLSQALAANRNVEIAITGDSLELSLIRGHSDKHLTMSYDESSEAWVITVPPGSDYTVRVYKDHPSNTNLVPVQGSSLIVENQALVIDFAQSHSIQRFAFYMGARNVTRSLDVLSSSDLLFRHMYDGETTIEMPILDFDKPERVILAALDNLVAEASEVAEAHFPFKTYLEIPVLLNTVAEKWSEVSFIAEGMIAEYLKTRLASEPQIAGFRFLVYDSEKFNAAINRGGRRAMDNIILSKSMKPTYMTRVYSSPAHTEEWAVTIDDETKIGKLYFADPSQTTRFLLHAIVKTVRGSDLGRVLNMRRDEAGNLYYAVYLDELGVYWFKENELIEADDR